jgi:hypothetical protein
LGFFFARGVPSFPFVFFLRLKRPKGPRPLFPLYRNLAGVKVRLAARVFPPPRPAVKIARAPRDDASSFALATFAEFL